MHTCDQCSDLWLDYLYGLLDEGEAQALREHLAACPSCPASLAAAESQQGLLARAAQVYAAVPAFTAPAAEPTPDAPTPAPPPPVGGGVGEGGATLPMPAPTGRFRRWRGLV